MCSAFLHGLKESGQGQKKAGKVGLAQLTMQGCEHLCAIAPIEKKGLLLEVIRYENELRQGV